MLAANATTPIQARVSGLVEAVYCAVDGKVKASQLCAKIDAAPYQAVVDKDQAELSEAQAQSRKDDALLARARAAAERSGASARQRKSYEIAQARMERDETTSARLQAALQAARIDLAETKVVAPVDGAIVARNVEPGQKVAAGDAAPLFLIATDLAMMKILATVDEKDIGEIKLGDRVSFSVENLPGRSFNGEVTQVESPNVVIAAPNPDLSLKPGMRATVKITKASTRGKP